MINSTENARKFFEPHPDDEGKLYWSLAAMDYVEKKMVAYASACSAPSSIGDAEIEAYIEEWHDSIQFVARDTIKWAISRLSERKIVLPELKPMPRLNDSEYTYRKAWNECLSEIKRLNGIN